jgi:mono/diheme cytochrome c family protein
MPHSEMKGLLPDPVRDEVLRRDRRVSLALLGISLAVLAILAASHLRDSVRASWRVHQLDYRDLLRQHATDERGRQLAAEFTLEVRQAVIPALGAVDRCASCHGGLDDPRMVGVGQPHEVHPGKALQQHEGSEYGCVICHRGQGRALDFKSAKGDSHHWDYPLLPAGLTQSSCGLCHTAAEVQSAGGEKYAAGLALYEAKGCASCHKLGGRGGSLGPALDSEGLKVAGQLPMTFIQGEHNLPQWLLEHFDDPQRVVAKSQMPPPQLSPDEAEALVVFLLSLQKGKDLPGRYITPAKHLEMYQQAHPDPLSGEQLYRRYCSTCHDTGTYGRFDKFFGKFIPAIRGATYAQTTSSAYLRENIRRGRPGTIMPSWGLRSGGLTEAEISRLADFLPRAPRRAPDALPAEVVAGASSASFAKAGDADRGQAIFRKHCAGCHGLGGGGVLGPSLDSVAFQSAATPGYIFTTIAYGRRNTAMMSFLAEGEGGLSRRDVADLTAHVRTLSTGAGTPPVAQTPPPPAAAR